ncbi:ABC transporter permease [Spiroplasma cantharicola]|uniref:Ribose/galactose ABC transporter permease n=1 Tax=Spiroplasma cantharicola TaxID=362837 RepID=A0A0M3SJ24_9MOLU|nr:ABC transporter permease [Spiroplasma cantharicola]ALD65998.1 ribose/galactose ABC transporter permease [Spiroplasma cantharicola]
MTDFISALFSDTSTFFAIFMLAAIAGMFSERSGVVNLGIEGFMTMGALGYSLFGFAVHSSGAEISQWWQLIGLFVGAVMGGLLSLLHAFTAIKLKGDQIISGTAINILAQGIALVLATSTLTGPENYISTGFMVIGIGSGINIIITLYLVIAIIISLIVGFYFTFTKTGTRHIAAGENPHALDSAGISVTKYRVVCILISGMLAGLAGAIFVVSRLLGSFAGSVQGYGYISLAIMILGQWRISMIALFSFVFSLMFAFGTRLPVIENAGNWMKTNGSLFRILPFVMSLVIMMIFARKSKPPKANGIPFDKTQR